MLLEFCNHVSYSASPITAVKKSIGRIMKACVILHNMIVEDEKEMAKFPIDLNE